MDLSDYDQAVFDAIVADYAPSRARDRIEASPHADFGLQGRQHHRASPTRPWYTGPPLIEHLETVEVDVTRDQASRSACRCNGSTARTSISGASRA
jgi:bifunctional enzyme CysN/CysC